MIQVITAQQPSQINLSKADTATNQNLLLELFLKALKALSLFLTILGKVEKENTSKPNMHVQSKIERRNTQKQIQKNKKEEQIRNAKFFGGARGAAKIVVRTFNDSVLMFPR